MVIVGIIVIVCEHLLFMCIEETQCKSFKFISHIYLCYMYVHICSYGTGSCTFYLVVTYVICHSLFMAIAARLFITEASKLSISRSDTEDTDYSGSEYFCNSPYKAQKKGLTVRRL